MEAGEIPSGAPDEDRIYPGIPEEPLTEEDENGELGGLITSAVLPGGSEQTAGKDTDDEAALSEDDEIPSDQESEEERPAYDPTGRQMYRNACKRYGVTPAAGFLRSCENEEVKLSHYGVGPKGAKAIAAAMQNNTKVLRLYLKDNGLHEDGCQVLCKMMEDNCYITHFSLSRNEMRLVGSMAARKMIRNNSTLSHLVCSGNCLDDHCAEHWAEAIRASLHLKVLDLSNNEFCEEGGKALGTAIGENESLQELSLRWNHLRQDGAIAVALAMGNNQMLKKLNLAWNGFANEGAAAMGEALKSNSSLEELDLSHNRISEDGAKMLAKGIAVNESLKVLKLGNNPLKMAGVSAILQAMKSNPNNSIVFLDLESITVTMSVMEMLNELKASRPNLKISHAGLGGAEARQQSEKQKEPMVLVKQYIDRANLRLVDFFNSIDKDKSMSVTVEEFEIGLAVSVKGNGAPRTMLCHCAMQRAKVALTKEQIKELVAKLDQDGDGEIDYGEFVYGAQQVTQSEREQKKKRNLEVKMEKADQQRKSQVFRQQQEDVAADQRSTAAL